MNVMTRGDSQLNRPGHCVRVPSLSTVSPRAPSGRAAGHLLVGGGVSLSGDPNPVITGVGEPWAGMLCAHFCPFSGAQGGTEALHVTGLEGALHLPGPPQKLGKDEPTFARREGAKPCETKSLRATLEARSFHRSQRDSGGSLANSSSHG